MVTSTTTDQEMYGQDYNEDRGLGQPSPSSAEPTKDVHTAHPEREMEPGDPNLVGAAPAAEKRGMVDKVKGMFGGLKKGHHHQNTDSAVGSGVGHTPSSSPYGTGAGEDEFTGHSLDPTASPAPGNLESKKKTGSPEAGPWPHPTNPRGETNAQGGAVLTDEHGNLHPGPHDDSVKKEGFMSKLKDKLHTPKH